MIMPKKKTDKLPVSLRYERARIEERKMLQFIPNTVKDGEAIIVRTKKWAGISEPCFVVVNNKGEITVKQIKEEKE